MRKTDHIEHGRIPDLRQWRRGAFGSRQLNVKGGGLYTIGKIRVGRRYRWTANYLPANSSKATDLGSFFAAALPALGAVRMHFRYFIA